jgi:hypothetical protein
MSTLLHKRHLLNPFRHGLFSWMLFSHKVCRWLLPWAALVGLAGLTVLSATHLWARLLLAGAMAVVVVGALAWRLGGDRRLPAVLAIPAFTLMGNVAALRASLKALAGARNAVWEPTRRPAGG